MKDNLKRYFVGNEAPIFRVSIFKKMNRNKWFLKTRGANFYGIWIYNFFIQFRMPYHAIWNFNKQSKRWET